MVVRQWLRTLFQKFSKNTDQAEGHHGHDGRRNTYAQEDGRNGLFQTHVQHRRHQGTRPGAGARQWNGHQDAKKTNGTVFGHHPAFQVGFFLQPGDLSSHHVLRLRSQVNTFRM